MISIGVSKRFNFANTLRSANLAESLDGLAIERSSNIKLILSSCQQITLIRIASFLHFEWLNINLHLSNKSSTAFRKSQDFCHQKIGHILAYFKFLNYTKLLVYWYFYIFLCIIFLSRAKTGTFDKVYSNFTFHNRGGLQLASRSSNRFYWIQIQLKLVEECKFQLSKMGTESTSASQL